MDLRRPSAATSGSAAAPALQPESPVRSDVRNEVRSDTRTGVRTDLRNAVRHGASAPNKSSGYGMPCATCRLYYPANLDACPACNGQERISPFERGLPPAQTAQSAEPALDNPVIDQERVEKEREEFLKQFKSEVLAPREQATSAVAACTVGGHNVEAGENASVCKPCYDRLQERVDVFEAALHIDLKEAAQIVYDAVWADPSDPSKTYANAASALISELRKRSGVSGLISPFQPLGN